MNYLLPLIAECQTVKMLSKSEQRKQRTECHGIIDYDVLQKLPWLPSRVEISDLKANGLVALRHATHEHRTPWLRKGWYRLIGKDGRLYVVEISSTVACGNPPCAWIYRPKVRIKMSVYQERPQREVGSIPPGHGRVSRTVHYFE